MRLVVIVVLLLVQAFVSLFYASAAMAMWGPFMEGLPTAKLLVGAIVVVPVLSFFAVHERIRLPSIGSLGAVGIITVLQLALVLILLTTPP